MTVPETAMAVATATPCALIIEHMGERKEREVLGFDE